MEMNCLTESRLGAANSGWGWGGLDSEDFGAICTLVFPFPETGTETHPEFSGSHLDLDVGARQISTWINMSQTSFKDQRPC